MVEKHKEEWWGKISERIKKKATKRMEDEAKFRWHGARGGTEIEYCDFGDLSSIIVANWPVFEEILVDMEWAKSLLSILERSRNIVMHGGVLARQDIERIGMNIRDWVNDKQANKRMHSDKTKLRRYAIQLYFSGDAKRYVTRK